MQRLAFVPTTRRLLLLPPLFALATVSSFSVARHRGPRITIAPSPPPFFSTTTSSSSSSVLFLRDDHANDDHDDDDHDQDDDGIVRDFDDFGGLEIGRVDDDDDGSTTTTTLTGLSDRVAAVRRTEREEDGRVFRNWERGNWSVRGFSLDKTSTFVAPSDGRPERRRRRRTKGTDDDDDDQERDPYDQDDDPAMVSVPYRREREFDDDDERDVPVRVRRLALRGDDDDDDDDDSHYLAVGRTDGSVYVVRLGTDPLTTFSSVPELTMRQRPDDGANVVEYRDRMVRSNENDRNDDQDDDDRRPFEVVRELARVRSDGRRGGDPVTALLFATDALLVAAGGTLREWSLTDLEDDDSSSRDEDENEPSDYADDGSDAEIVALARFPENDLVLSARRDGTVSLHDRRTRSLVASFREDAGVASAAADRRRGLLWLGRADGRVVAYDVASLTKDDDAPPPRPCVSFAADEREAAVTALECGGGTVTMGENSTVLLTGSATGTVKRWETLVTRTDDGVVRVQHWPRASTQRFRDAAHLLASNNNNNNNDDDDGGAVTCLRTLKGRPRSDDDDVDARRRGGGGDLVLAADDGGRVRAVSTTDGRTLYEMEGFDDGLSSLCLVRRERGGGDGAAALVTDGMDHMVCLHDFGHGLLGGGDDGEFEVEDWLDFDGGDDD